ncbi:hypothetical protein L249_3205 [Ophiocordyceps polyrhachis-furcata BCC 54312]|uniref:Uncharacterized protein n=1 Tax=Ophiocordyceps polyrhachis-furcata BCC 54312 TaxID=1330021 RepID=A0A367LPF0_9HYPO|nr:hypothetical protein L249_3205 [Ophiocordyceps polyrhachis-furcata BCC 54312]
MPPPPPSYLDAVSKPDWLLLAMPYIRVQDLTSLCRVNGRFWRVFAPRIWRDLLTFVRIVGRLDPADDLSWWIDFVFNKLHLTSPATRALVRIIDARAFAKLACDFSTDRLLERSLAAALTLLPNVDCLLLDGHDGLDPDVVLHRRLRLRLLSVSDCPYPLSSRILASRPCFHHLVFLDASAVPGSVLSLLRPRLLPELAVLKLRRREVNDVALAALVACFPPRLWSLDLGDNYLSDAAVDALLSASSSSSSASFSSLRSASRFHVEGEAVSLPGEAFAFIAESRWSGTFSHPERYFVDAPAYYDEPNRLPRFNRHCAPLRRDSAEAVWRAGPEPEDGYRRPPGITHLHLSGNRLSSFGLQRLLRLSSGQLEEFDCRSMPLLPAGPIPGLDGDHSTHRLYGLLGAAHLFRPVLSSNLRALRIHHSLVTHVPTIETTDDDDDDDGRLCPLSRLYLAETSVLDRVMDLYPQTYEPDMNPRLVKLTLTCVPRRSSGPLTASLIRFLDLLASQERAIEEEASSSSATMLQGLRHLALEFEPDPMDDGCRQDVAASEECNLAGEEEQGFSFFPVSSSSSSRRPPSSCHRHHHAYYNRDKVDESVWLPSSSSSSSSSSPPLRDYRRLVLEEGICHGKAPVTPCQVRAGLPPTSYVYQTAYAAAVMPSELGRPPFPSRQLLAGVMRDVVADLRAFRRGGGGGRERKKNCWRGDLSVTTC